MKFDARFLSIFLIFGVVMYLTVLDQVQVEAYKAAAEAHQVQVDQERVDIEQANFMLRCVHDFGVKPDECRAILNGEDPKPYEEGC